MAATSAPQNDRNGTLRSLNLPTTQQTIHLANSQASLDRNDPTPTAHTVKKQGVLYKRSGIRKSWKTFHFTLEGNLLYYYKNENDATPNGVILLTGCIITRTKSKKYYSFRISHPSSTIDHELAATLESRAIEWIDYLQEAAGLNSGKHQCSQNQNGFQVDSMDFDAASFINTGGSMDFTMQPSPLTNSGEQAMSFLEPRDENIADIDTVPCNSTEDLTENVPQEFQNLIETLMKEFLNHTNVDDGGWKVRLEKANVRVMTKARFKAGLCRSMGYVPHTPLQIIKLLLNVRERHTFDLQIQATERLCVWNKHTFLDHLTYQAVFPASSRDFLHLTHWRVLPDGRILVLSTSVVDEELCPAKNPAIIRGYTAMEGYLISPNFAYTGADVTYIVMATTKSGMPDSLQMKLFVKQALIIDSIRTVLSCQRDQSISNDNSGDQLTINDLNSNTAIEKVTNSTDFSVEPIAHHEHVEESELESQPVTTERLGSNNSFEDNQISPTSAEISNPPEEGIPCVPAQYKEMIMKALARFELDLDSDKWEFHSVKHGVRSFIRTDGSLTACKGVGYVPFHPRAICDTILDIKKAKILEPGIKNAACLKKFDPQTCIDHIEYKPVFVVAGRDFSNLVHWRVLPGGSILIIIQSIEDLTLCPLREPLVVRGDVHIAGWKIAPNLTYDGAIVSYMSKSDLKGSVPLRFAKKVAAEQPYQIHRLCEDLAKRLSTNDPYEFEGKMTNISPVDEYRLSDPACSAPLDFERVVPPVDGTLTCPDEISNTNRMGSFQGCGTLSSLNYTPNTSSVRTNSRERRRAASDALIRPHTSQNAPSISPATLESSHKNTTDSSFKGNGRTGINTQDQVNMTKCRRTSSTANNSAKSMPPSDSSKYALPTSYTASNIVQYAVEIFIALLILKFLGALNSTSYTVLLLLSVFLFIRALLGGNSSMSSRRKQLVSSWLPPQSGETYGLLQVDVSKTLEYIKQKRITNEAHITITHIVVKALGAAMRKAPCLNGQIRFGNHSTVSSSVDLSCLIAFGAPNPTRHSNNKNAPSQLNRNISPRHSVDTDVGVCRFKHVDNMSLKEVCWTLEQKTSKLRTNKDILEQRLKAVLSWLPTYILRPFLKVVGYCSNVLGINMSQFGLEDRNFGSCVVNSVGMMGLDCVYTPISPWMNVSMVATICRIEEKPVVVNGQVVAKPILTITTTIDHRYIDGVQVARMAKYLKGYIEDPSLLESIRYVPSHLAKISSNEGRRSNSANAGT